MCDITYIAVYNTYLHGRYFLSPLYKDISCLTPPHSTLLFLPSDSSSHRMSPVHCLSCSLPTDQRHTSCRITTRSVFACAANTGHTAVFILWKANAVNESTELGRSWTWSAAWSATSCHIFFVWMDNSKYMRECQYINPSAWRAGRYRHSENKRRRGMTGYIVTLHALTHRMISPEHTDQI
jgi:hypothetical protein